MSISPRIGVFAPMDLPDRGPDATSTFLATVAAAGLDHVCCGDHVSFGGAGSDGLLQAAVLAAAHPSLPVHTGVYLLSLRHPVLVARQLADIHRLAPGRIVFGVGIGGEDRREVAMCGVNPGTRGVRMDECLTCLRALGTGAAVTHHGRFFDLDTAVVRPPAPVTITVGGRSDAAVRRAGRLGDGWLGIWNSPRRFTEATALAGEIAAQAGRADYPARHAMQVWCGLADTRETARTSLAAAMQNFYRLPFDVFERYCPYGTPADVAEFLGPYLLAGCTEFNLIPVAESDEAAVGGVADVQRLLSTA